METMVQQFVEAGFPVVVTSFLLVRMESRLESLTTAILELSSLLAVRFKE